MCTWVLFLATLTGTPQYVSTTPEQAFAAGSIRLHATKTDDPRTARNPQFMKHLFRSSLALSTFALASVISSLASAQTAPAPAGNDHEAVAGHLGVGYLGRRGMSVGTIGNEVVAPVIGVRYWMNSQMGIDAGLGLTVTSTSSEAKFAGVTTKVDGPSTTVFMLHGGVPLSLMSGKHYSFQITPELNLGLGSGSSEDNMGGKIDTSGFHIDLGARAGAEVHFGFMGIPELSLLGSVGLNLANDSVSTETPPASVGAPRTEVSASQTALSTTVGNSPWSIFTSNVAAIYYF